jgi:hypothetical protein
MAQCSYTLFDPIKRDYLHARMDLMDPLLNNAVSVKTSTGNMGFGTVEWVVRDSIQILADLSTDKGIVCEIRMELLGLPRSIHLSAEVTDIWPADSGESHIRLQLTSEQTEDRVRLNRWLEDQAKGGTSVDPASWTQDLSGVHSRRGRKNITEAFRERRESRRTLKMPVIDIPIDELTSDIEGK